MAAVDGLDLRIPCGEVVAFLGPNGAGKTTTIDMVRGLSSAAGASGFVVEDTPARQLADAVRRVHAGLRVVDPVLAAEPLTAGGRPADVARDRPASGRARRRHGRRPGTVADLARVPHLSEGIVRNYLSSAMGKTGARTRAEAVRIAEESGWLLPR